MKPYFSSNATGTELVALGNSNLKWQQTGTWNVGLELSLLKGRFTTRAEYYIKNTKNSLAQITLAPSVGFASYPENMGNLETKGVELNFSFIPYRNLDKDAYWVITVNGSHNEEKLKKISDALRHMNELNTSNEKDKPLPMYEEGESQTRIWVVRSLGIDPMTGDELLLTRNGKVTSEYNAINKISSAKHARLLSIQFKSIYLQKSSDFSDHFFRRKRSGESQIITVSCISYLPFSAPFPHMHIKRAHDQIGHGRGSRRTLRKPVSHTTELCQHFPDRRRKMCSRKCILIDQNPCDLIEKILNIQF